ncbi:hypothetical protein D3C87_1444610 [compost metagenome]
MVARKGVVADHRRQVRDSDRDALQNQHGLPHRSGAKEHPGYQDEMKGEKHGEQVAHPVRDQPGAGQLCGQGRQSHLTPLIETVQQSPDQETPPQPIAEPGMPEPADKEDHHDVDVSPADASPAAAQRYIEIVAEPAPQRDMPALRPEFGDRAREIGATEVDGQLDAEQARDADRHVGNA